MLSNDKHVTNICIVIEFTGEEQSTYKDDKLRLIKEKKKKKKNSNSDLLYYLFFTMFLINKISFVILQKESDLEIIVYI